MPFNKELYEKNYKEGTRIRGENFSHREGEYNGRNRCDEAENNLRTLKESHGSLKEYLTYRQESGSTGRRVLPAPDRMGRTHGQIRDSKGCIAGYRFGL